MGQQVLSALCALPRSGARPSGHRAPVAPCRAARPAAPPRACSARAKGPVRAPQGYVDYDPALRLEGVILNRVGGEAHARWLTEAVAGSGVATRVLGGIPEARPLFLPFTPAARRSSPAALRASLQSVAVGGGGGCAARGALACAARGGRSTCEASARASRGRASARGRAAAPAQHLPPWRTRSLCPFKAGRGRWCGQRAGGAHGMTAGRRPAQDESLASCERALGGELPKPLAAALAAVAAAHVDLDALLELAATARPPPPPPALGATGAGGPGWPPCERGARVRIGVARDAAFGFYYAECVPGLLAPAARGHRRTDAHPVSRSRDAPLAPAGPLRVQRGARLHVGRAHSRGRPSGPRARRACLHACRPC